MNAPLRSAITIGHVDDHPAYLRGVGRDVAEGGMLVVGHAKNTEEALDLARQKNPTVMLVDINLKGDSGLHLTRELRRVTPRIGVLVLSAERSQRYVASARLAGARGYVCKEEDYDVLLRRIRAVAEGGEYFPEWFDPALTAESPECLLTPRQLEVVCWVARGLSNKEVGERMAISERGVEAHRRDSIERLGLKGANSAIAFHELLSGWGLLK
jgi:DNA-binding NarL/FixJ family response regulator